MKNIKVAFAWFFLSVASALCWMRLCVSSQNERQREEEDFGKRRMEWSRKYAPELYREDVGDEEARALKCLYAEIARAYTNNQLNVMLECIGALSNRVQNIQDNLFYGMEHLIYAPFVDGFCNMRSFDFFPTPEAFEQYADINCEMAKFIGRMCFLRKDYWDAHLLKIESETFAKLRKYSEEFMKEGRSDLAHVANRHIDKWKEFIESNEGISRLLARYQYEQHMDLNVREGRQVVTHEHATRLARAMAEPLKKAGYTPKWLDEDFPYPSKPNPSKVYNARKRNVSN